LELEPVHGPTIELAATGRTGLVRRERFPVPVDEAREPRIERRPRTWHDVRRGAVISGEVAAHPRLGRLDWVGRDPGAVVDDPARRVAAARRLERVVDDRRAEPDSVALQTLGG